ncbi:hypothetical protein JCM5350_000467 [Sporobolomyces pararoseus]
MSSAPTSIIIPASPLDAQLLSASSAFQYVPPSHHLQPSSTSPSTYSTVGSGTVQASGPQHFITKRQFEKWQVSQPKESRQLRPPTTSEGIDKMTLQGYRAPQHPASHLLQSIPPRAPSRSSRSNILSYSLYSATASRLASYSSENGTRTLLHWAESDRQGSDSCYEPIEISSEWFESEKYTKGLWKISLNLLNASKRDTGDNLLPRSVERRLVLAGLVEELLVSPSGERAIIKIDEDTTNPSNKVEQLLALKPLTSPDTTTLYLSTSTHHHRHHHLQDAQSNDSASSSRDPRDRSHSVAQSLIDLKFGGGSKPTTPATTESNPSSSSSAIPGPSVFGDQQTSSTLSPSLPNLSSSSDPTSSTSSELVTATPHMDYRIVQSQSMRSRAKQIFSVSPLPSLTSSFCRRHRCSDCTVCSTLIREQEERVGDHERDKRRNVPGAGLREVNSITMEGQEGTKKALVGLVPVFLKLSADFIRDLKDHYQQRERGKVEEDSVVVSSEEEVEKKKKKGNGKGKGKEVEEEEEEEDFKIHATSSWYDLLTSLLTQACLEGYLVDGWTGTEGIETLFGVGCGVWEGRGWSTATRPSTLSSSSPRKREEVPVVVVQNEGGEKGSGDEEDDEDEEEDEEEIRRRDRERETMELVEAAHALFGSRDVAQAEYERGMRDRIHEFLNVPRDKNLIQHLNQLNAKYPLSSFEDDMVDFLESSVRALGKPALAKFDPRSASTASNSSIRSATPAASDPDPFALAQYFSATANTAPATPTSENTFSRPEGKRRRID